MTVTLLFIAFLILSMVNFNVTPCMKNYILFKSLAILRRNLMTCSFPVTSLNYVISQNSLVVFFFFTFAVFFFFLFLPFSSSSSIFSFSTGRRVKKTEAWGHLHQQHHFPVPFNQFHHTVLTLSPWQLTKALPAWFAYIASVDSLSTTMRILLFDKTCFLGKATFHLRRQGISKIPDYPGLFHIINTKPRANDLTNYFFSMKDYFQAFSYILLSCQFVFFFLNILHLMLLEGKCTSEWLY